jgi:UDP-glucose 4-epimerase
MKIAITGSGGFIGKNLLLDLSPDYQITAFARGGSVPEFVDNHSLSGVEVALCDFTDSQSIAALADKLGPDLDAVIYLAGNGDPAYSVSHPAVDLTDTVLGLVNFLSNFKVGRFIYFSSGAVYDGLSGPVSPDSALDPRLPYAIGKLACEQYIKFFRKVGRIDNYVILRFFGAYGPFEPPRKIYSRLVRAFALEKKNEYTIRGDGRNLIDAMFVDDTVRGVRSVLESAENDLILDFCLGRPYTIKKLVEETARIFNIKARINMEGEVPEYIDFRPSPRMMEDLFGFTPAIPLDEGLPILAQHLSGDT